MVLTQMVGLTHSQLKHEVISVEGMGFILSGMDYSLMMELLLCNRRRTRAQIQIPSFDYLVFT